jgi:ketosteroid isomerase-like protein
MNTPTVAGRLLAGLTILILLAGCAAGASPTPTPAPSSAPSLAVTTLGPTPVPTVTPAPTSSPAAANAADTIARKWLAAVQAKDLDAMAALWAPDGVWEDGATGESFTGGPQAERSGSAEAMAMMIAIKNATVLALGDGVAVLAYTRYGTTPAHSAPIDMPFITVLYVKDAQITRETIYYNPRLAYGS